MSHWKILERELIYAADPWLKLYKESIELPDGRKIKDFYQIEQRDYVEIVAMRADKKILGLWAYKHGIKKVHLGLPAGYIEKHERAMDAAKRELAEECKLESNHWKKLGEFALEGNRGPAAAHIYLAQQCIATQLNLSSDDLELGEPEWLSMNDWLTHVTNGNVAVIGTPVAILLTKNELKL